MKRDKLEAMHQATDHFISKRLRVNKPFQSLILTPQFETFQKALKKALKDQFKSVADVVGQAHMVALLNDDMIRQFVETNMPPLTDYLTQDEIFEFLKFCFIEGVRAQYGRFGLKTTAQKADFGTDDFDFELTNQDLIDALLSEADFLLNKSNIDATTRDQLIRLIQANKIGDNATVDEIASAITDAMPDISDSRAFTIARTETARAMGEGNYNAMVQNGVQTKRWVLAGSKPCEICQPNADDGYIPIDQAFSSGDDYEPAHPNCECYTEAGEIDLDSIDIWDGS